MSIMRDELPGPRVGGAVALLSAMLGIGGDVGVPFSGTLLGTFGRQSLFWLSAELSPASIIALLVIAPEPPPRQREPFDLAAPASARHQHGW